MLFEVLGIVFHPVSFCLASGMLLLAVLCNSPVQLSLVLNARHRIPPFFNVLGFTESLVLNPIRVCVNSKFLGNI